MLVPSPCRSRAASRHLTRASPSKGLVRKQVVPACGARARALSMAKAVMKMNGARCPLVSKWACSSTPIIVGICTSAITHEVSFRWGDRKNSSADANVWTTYPSDLTRLWVAARTDPSSSIIEITGGLDNAVLPGDAQSCLLLHSRATAECFANQGPKIIL